MLPTSLLLARIAPVTRTMPVPADTRAARAHKLAVARLVAVSLAVACRAQLAIVSRAIDAGR